MKLTKKLLLLASIFTLCLGFTLTAQAADMQFKKKTVIFKEGQTKNLTLLNSEKSPEVLYYEPSTSLFSYKVQGTSKIQVTAKRAGIDYITVSNGDTGISCCLVVMPKDNPNVKSKEKKNGKTIVTYKKVKVTLPKAWKKYGYVVLPGEDSISFHSKFNYRRGYYGNLFSIEWCSAAEYAERSTYLPNFTFLKQTGDTVYYMTFPTDVQFKPDSQKCQKQYKALEKTITSIRKTLKIKK